MLRTLLLIPLAISPGLVFAHEGHGHASASHWHASDSWGFVALLAVAALGLWLNRRK